MRKSEWVEQVKQGWLCVCGRWSLQSAEGWASRLDTGISILHLCQLLSLCVVSGFPHLSTELHILSRVSGVWWPPYNIISWFSYYKVSLITREVVYLFVKTNSPLKIIFPTEKSWIQPYSLPFSRSDDSKLGMQSLFSTKPEIIKHNKNKTVFALCTQCGNIDMHVLIIFKNIWRRIVKPDRSNISFLNNFSK